ncbi:MAG: SDR family NAD(P)-dependent oxidoreductase [Chromatiales bacterium]|jgi:NAD(P)-dependent dehydrogenase (short-subunit alcohol dehydrogenase family)
MPRTLEHKTAIVTGAASGIGRAIARLFAAEGASVLAIDLPGKHLAQQFEDGGQVGCLELDITMDDAPALIVADMRARFGGLDILVNNAGICIGAEFEATTDEIWERIMAVNVTAMFRLTREATGLLKAGARGRVINVGSIMSDMAGPGLAAYGTSKHAVAGLTKAMAVDLGKYQITANYLQPGSIITALSEPFLGDPEFRSYWENKAPIGRLGEAEDVAAAALFLASDAAQFVTGVGFNVDGGAIVNF